MSDQHRFDLSAVTNAASDALSVQRVFGEAYEREGTLVIPVAKILGGNALASADGEAGVGHSAPGAGPGAEAGTSPESEPQADAPHPADGHGPHRPGGPGIHWHLPHGHGHGSGEADAGAYLTHARPLGVYVVDVDGVHWRPALDLNRVILGGQIAGMVTVVALAWALRRRRR